MKQLYFARNGQQKTSLPVGKMVRDGSYRRQDTKNGQTERNEVNC